MNYRHAYHAGNFADVLKHLVLALVIDYMKRKEAPFRVIDTHAGCGRYALGSIQAAKTGEWRGGIGRLLGPDARPLAPDVASVMAPYLDAVRAENPTLQLEVYPGSPLIARRLMRAQDVLVANELHPEDCADLKSASDEIGGSSCLLSTDGWRSSRCCLPRSGAAVVLIDPPFEEEGEFDRLAEGLAEAIAALRDRRLHCVVPDQGSQADCRLSLCAWRHGGTRAAAIGAHDTRTGTCSRPPQRLRADRCQSSVYATRSSRGCSARADAASGRRQRSAPPPRPHRAHPEPCHRFATTTSHRRNAPRR